MSCFRQIFIRLRIEVRHYTRLYKLPGPVMNTLINKKSIQLRMSERKSKLLIVSKIRDCVEEVTHSGRTRPGDSILNTKTSSVLLRAPRTPTLCLS